MAKSKAIEAIVIKEYVAMDVPADDVAAFPDIAAQLMENVNSQLSADERFESPQAFAKHLVNMRRRGSKRGGLPKLRGGHGPGGKNAD
jgi:hypothetical protein